MHSTRLSFLGVPAFERDGESASLASAKGVALLAFLAASGPQPRERLLDLLWPDSFPAAARKNLRNTLWRIGRDLGEIVSSEGERLALLPELWVDTLAFERDEGDPLALYRGPFLDGVALAEAPDMELWITGERERFAGRFRALAEQAIAARRAGGDWRAVIEIARRALAHDPLQEPLHVALIEAHARLGERAEALRQHDALRALMERELGVPLLPESEALRASILAGELEATPRAAPTVAAPAPPRAHRADSRPFVGRASEWSALDIVLAEVQGSQQAKVALLGGEVGIGKSRLWQEWAARLPADWPVLETRALDVTRALPLAPLAELLSQDAALRPLWQPGSPLSPLWLAELARLVPDLRLARPDLPPALLPADEARHRLYEALARALLALPGRPLILWVDDIHWADHATLDALGYLTHRLADEPFLLAAAYRPAEATGELARQIEGWARAGRLRQIALDRLSPREATQLVAALGESGERATRAEAQSGGNPLFLLELSRSEGEELPPALEALLGARVARLPDEARQLVQGAAILTPPFDFATLAGVASLDEERALDALDTLREAALLEERGPHYAFSHPIVAEVVRAGMSAARRRVLHRRAAEALEARGGDLSARAVALAEHWAAAGEAARAADYAEGAGRYALSLAAPDEAAAAFSRALALAPTAARALARGQALLLAGEWPEAELALQEALALAEAAGDRGALALGYQVLAQRALPLGQPDEMIRWADRSMEYLDIERDHELHAMAHFLRGTGAMQQPGGLEAAARELAEANRLALLHDLPEVAARARFEGGNLLAQRGDLPAALDGYLAAAALARGARDSFMETLAYNNAAYHAMLMGELARAHDYIARAFELAESESLVGPRQYLYSTRGEIAMAEERWEEAESWFERAWAEAERNHNQRQLATVGANRALVARGRGDLDGARARLLDARARMATVQDPHLAIQIELWLAEVARALGDEAQATEALDRAGALLADGSRAALRARWEAMNEKAKGKR